jgi:hypothetical protein
MEPTLVLAVPEGRKPIARDISPGNVKALFPFSSVRTVERIPGVTPVRLKNLNLSLNPDAIYSN